MNGATPEFEETIRNGRADARWPGGGGGRLEDRDRPGDLLSAELSGDLPCVVCRYNLKGVSIRDVCPECGTAVRATILARVDPLAAELRPIRWPWLTGAGLGLWLTLALAAAVLMWVPYAAMVWSDLTGRAVPVPTLGTPIVVLVALAGVAAAASIVRPHSGLVRRHIWMAGAGAALHLPLAVALGELRRPGTFDVGRVFGPRIGSVGDYVLTMTAWALMSAVVLLIRPHARLLVARSLALRTGRVDRQALTAVAVCAGIAAGGETLIALAAGAGAGTMAYDPLRLLGFILLITGSALVTLGIAGATVDAWRIARAIIAPAPALEDVLGGSGRGRNGRGGKAHGEGAP